MVGIAEQLTLFMNALTGLTILGFVGILIYLFYAVFRGKWPSSNDTIDPPRDID